MDGLIRGLKGIGQTSPVAPGLGVSPNQAMAVPRSRAAGGAALVWPIMVADNSPSGYAINWVSPSDDVTLMQEYANGAYYVHNGSAPTGQDPALTNSVSSANLRLTLPSPMMAVQWRAHNLGSTWGDSRMPSSVYLQGAANALGPWITLDGPCSILTDQDTGWRTIPGAAPYLFYRLQCTGGASAISLASWDMR